MARSKLIELFTRLIKPQERKDKIYCNGIDNQYPERIERIINNSVTAKLSTDKFKAFILGLGFNEETLNEKIVNRRKSLTAYDVLEMICDDVSYQKGFALHINYDMDGKVNYLDVLKFKSCRISEEDDYDYSGYVWHQKEWSAAHALSVRDKKKKNWFYPYDPDIEIINEQRRNDAPENASPEQLIRSYRGQVLFVNLDGRSVYPNAFIDPAYNDADTENRISLFRNDRIKTGFIGANVIIVPEGTDEDHFEETEEQVKNLLGAENSSNLLVMEAKLDGDGKLSDQIHIETIKSEVDTKQFQYDEKMVQENIMNCYGVPKILVKNNDSALFGPNAESLRVAQRIFQEDTQRYRDAITNVLNKIFLKDELDFTIAPLIKDEDSNLEPENQEHAEVD